VDTIPGNRPQVKNIDEALADLELSRGELEKTMKEIDFQKMEKEIQQSMKSMNLDLAKMKEEISKAVKDIDAAKIHADVQKALKDIDAVKINAEVQKAMKEIDAAKISADIQKALKEIDAEKIKQSIETSVAKIDVEKMQKDLQKAKDIDMSQIEEKLKNLRPELEKSMADARKSMEKAREEIIAYKNLISDLDKEGLLNKDGEYTIEYKNGVLIVNGKTAPAAIVEKHRNLLDKKKDFTVEKNDKGFNIRNK
jgi:chromosome segregation ATPase